MPCTPNCVYFPTTETVKKEEIIDGVTYRSVVRRCAYDGFPIRSWKDCHRPNGKLESGDMNGV